MKNILASAVLLIFAVVAQGVELKATKPAAVESASESTMKVSKAAGQNWGGVTMVPVAVPAGMKSCRVEFTLSCGALTGAEAAILAEGWFTAPNSNAKVNGALLGSVKNAGGEKRLVRHLEVPAGVEKLHLLWYFYRGCAGDFTVKDVKVDFFATAPARALIVVPPAKAKESQVEDSSVAVAVKEGDAKWGSVAALVPIPAAGATECRITYEVSCSDFTNRDGDRAGLLVEAWFTAQESKRLVTPKMRVAGKFLEGQRKASDWHERSFTMAVPAGMNALQICWGFYAGACGEIRVRNVRVDFTNAAK